MAEIEEDIFESFGEKPPEELAGIGDDPEYLKEILEEKLSRIKAFQDPILQHQYEQLMGNEEKLLSLDSIIAMGKVRLELSMRRGKPMEVAQLTRSIVEAIEKAVYIRERHKEYIHLEQVLWLMDVLFEIVNDEVSDQIEVNRVAERLKRLRLPSRDEVPLEKKKLARALSSGRRRSEIDV